MEKVIIQKKKNRHYNNPYDYIYEKTKHDPRPRLIPFPQNFNIFTNYNF